MLSGENVLESGGGDKGVAGGPCEVGTQLDEWLDEDGGLDRNVEVALWGRSPVLGLGTAGLDVGF